MGVKTQLTEKGMRDYQLVQAALQRGDRTAYANLMNNYRDTLYFMLLKMTNNPQDADDLTIEAFGKAFKNLHQYSPEFAFSTWLFKIASNNCIDYLRKRNLSNNISLHSNDMDEEKQGMSISDIVPSEVPDPEEQFINQQKIKTMRLVIEKLKPHYKHLVELRYYKEYSYEEIADELDLPIGTVKAQLFRAREFLYNILKDHKEKF
jgi:RNA polymerase sigma factor (sigma-70 family)